MAQWIRVYQSYLERNGPWRASLGITVAITAFSVLFTAILVLLIEPTTFAGTVFIGLLVPLILSPPIGFFMATLVHELSRAHKSLQRIADRDMLTDAFTRRYFMTTVAERFAAGRDPQQSDSVVLVDIDDFKRINDNHGHPTGDRVLKAISECCRRMVREQDVFARFGGEEFVILIAGASPVRALPIVERIRLAIRQLEIRGPGGDLIAVSASFGIAASHPSSPSREVDTAANQLERALALADQALYDAKHGGKDRTVIASSPAAVGAMEALA